MLNTRSFFLFYNLNLNTALSRTELMADLYCKALQCQEKESQVVVTHVMTMLMTYEIQAESLFESITCNEPM